MNQQHSYTVLEQDNRLRLDIYLAQVAEDLSRSRLQKLIQQGAVSVNGVLTESPNHRVETGDIIVFDATPEKAPEKLRYEQGEIDVLFEDDHMLAINKPAGLLSHPNPGHDEGSVLNCLMHKGLKGGEDPMRQGLVHRLDRETSGVLILAKSDEAYEKLQSQFKDRLAKKIYHTLVYGHLFRMEFTCKASIARNPDQRNLRTISEDGREAQTNFRCLEILSPHVALLEARPLTGRTHQIRVHLLHEGFMIFGDRLYAKNYQACESRLCVSRTLLHSLQLNITHPISGKAMQIIAPYPADFANGIETLREREICTRNF